MKRVLISMIILALVVSSLFIPSIVPAQQQEVEWNFTESSEGWSPTNGVSPFNVINGILSTFITGFDPYIHSPVLDLSAESFYLLEIRIAVNKGTGMSIYWITDRSPQWGEDKRVNFDIIPDGKFHTYYIDLGSHKLWAGKIRQFRLDLEPPDVQGASMKIDYIKLTKSTSKIVITNVSSSVGIPIAGKSFNLLIDFENMGGENSRNLTLNVSFDKKTIVQKIGIVPPRSKRRIEIPIDLDKPGVYNTTVSILSDNSILAQRNISLFIARDDIMVSKSEDITLEGENILVRFARSGDGFSSVLFYGKTGGRLTLLSVIHPISRLIYINKGKEVNEVISPNINTLENNKVVLKYSSNLYDFQVTFKLSSKETIDVSYVLRPKEEIKILRFDGPWLRIGERSWGVTRKSALFPGLEWLEGEERSSNTLDVIEPYNLRLVPNPYKITTPAIGIELDKYLVGLLWKDNTQLSTIFCSPNWYEGQDNHLVGLFLPSVSEFVKENETTAFVPYKTYKGETLNINSKILVIPNGTVLDLVPKWLNLYGSLDYSFPRNYKEEIILCREGYKNIWDPNVCGWKHATPGNWNAERYPKDIFLLLLDYALTKDKDALNMANNALAQLTRDIRKLSNPGGSHIFEFQLPFLVGYLPEGLRGFKDFIDSYIKLQRTDGSWGYTSSMSMDSRKLGKEGETNIGLCATPASVILRYGRVSGDEKALESGLKALELMKQFKVPRGAQVWEVPVHTPDILASARAIDAYLEGYLITKDKEYLRYASYWAKTGLPFIYFWSKSDRPVMKYATIPVFGATFYNYSWFGYPVQWNGLVYAYELLRLAKYDKSFPWDRIGTGILSSGMHQQITEGIYKGLYPDSWDLINNLPRGPYINPEDILKPLYLMMGIKIDLDTKIVPFNQNKIYITTISNLRDIHVTDKEIRFTVERTPFKTKYVLVNGLKSLPKSVSVGGENVRQTKDIEISEKGWKYEKGSLVIKINSSLDTGIILSF